MSIRLDKPKLTGPSRIPQWYEVPYLRKQGIGCTQRLAHQPRNISRVAIKTCWEKIKLFEQYALMVVSIEPCLLYTANIHSETLNVATEFCAAELRSQTRTFTWVNQAAIVSQLGLIIRIKPCPWTCSNYVGLHVGLWSWWRDNYKLNPLAGQCVVGLSENKANNNWAITKK